MWFCHYSCQIYWIDNILSFIGYYSVKCFRTVYTHDTSLAYLWLYCFVAQYHKHHKQYDKHEGILCWMLYLESNDDLPQACYLYVLLASTIKDAGDILRAEYIYEACLFLEDWLGDHTPSQQQFFFLNKHFINFLKRQHSIKSYYTVNQKSIHWIVKIVSELKQRSKKNIKVSFRLHYKPKHNGQLGTRLQQNYL